MRISQLLLKGTQPLHLLHILLALDFIILSFYIFPNMSEKKQSNNYTLSVSNKRLHDFYSTNPHISFEAMNLIFLGLLEPLNSDIGKLNNLTATGEILNYVKEIKLGMASLSDSVALKLDGHNRHFLETTKLVIGAASNDNTDKIVQILNRNTDTFIEKINTSIPKTQDDASRRIQDSLVALQLTLQTDIKTCMASSNRDGAIKEFMSSLEQRLQQQQQPIYTYLTSHQEQLTAQLTHIKDDVVSNRASSDKLFSELGDFLSKYKSSSQFKGQCSENMLEAVLNKLLPTADVANTTATKASGDFIIRREDKPTILIENKNYERNVNPEETKKFLRDVDEHRCSGIMMSQYSGIASKPNGFIEIHDTNVLVYLHKVDYSCDKIKMAIDVIDNLSVKLESISTQEDVSGIVIKKDVLDKINEQFQTFMNQRDVVLITLRESYKKVVSQVEDMKLPELSLFLNDKYASIQNQQFLCDTCNMAFTNKRSLASHKKMHKNKQTSFVEPENDNADEDI